MMREPVHAQDRQAVNSPKPWWVRWYLADTPVSVLVRWSYRRLRHHALVLLFRRWRVEQTLRRLHDVLATTPLAGHYWLWGGALLGIIREGRLLSHDLVDIDFGYRVEQRAAFQAAIPHLIAGGFQLRYGWRSNAGVITEHTFLKNQVRFDFFEFQPQGDLLCYWLYETESRVEAVGQIPQHGLQPIQFWRRQWLIPEQPEATLTAIYGDWRTPNPHYNWLVDEKSIVTRYPWHGSHQIHSAAAEERS